MQQQSGTAHAKHMMQTAPPSQRLRIRRGLGARRPLLTLIAAFSGLIVATASAQMYSSADPQSVKTGEGQSTVPPKPAVTPVVQTVTVTAEQNALKEVEAKS